MPNRNPRLPMAIPPEASCGLLLVDKAAGPSSHDVVAMARRALGTRRIGHTGTLDPFATGLLILCVGSATRLAEYLSGLPKRYEALLRLGEQTDTDDCTGAVITRSDRWRELSRADVTTALARRVGRQWQVPPGYSAKQVAGERLYEKARRGEAVTPAAVAVEIASMSLLTWNPPFAGFEVWCSSGTYVRAIARDLGLDLQTGAHLAELRRTAIGAHHVDASVPLTALQAGRFQGSLLAPVQALAHLPRIDIDDAAAAAIRHGRAIAAPGAPAALTVLVVWHAALLAVGAVADGVLHPKKVFDA